MMRYIKNRQIDLFAVPITLNHEGRDKAKSFHGAFITLLFAGFIAWFVYTVSKQMFDKQNPNTITFDTFKEIPDSIELNSETFPFAIGMQLPSSYSLAYFMDEEIYFPIVKLLVFKNIENPDGTITKDRQIIDIDIEPCTLKHFGSAADSAKNLPLSSLYCINPKQTHVDKIEVAGKEDLSTYKAFYIGIMKCVGVCKPDAEIKDKLTRSWINILYLQAAINPQNFENPNQRFMSGYSTMLSLNMLKSGIIRLNHLNVVDDDGWLFESKHTKNFVKVDAPIENLDPEADDDGFIYSGVFEMGQVTTTYERQYTKLQTVLAQIQGSAATVILVLIILLRPYSEVKFKETLINELFDVKVKKNDNNNNVNPTTENNEKRNAKKKKSLPGDLKLHKYSSMEGTKKDPQSGLELKLTKVQSKELDDGNKYGELLSDRPLKETGRENQEEKLSPKNSLNKVQSFKSLLGAIDNGANTPEVSVNQMSPMMTFEKRALLSQVKGQDLSLEVSSTRKVNKGLTLGIQKPDQAKIQGLSDAISDGPDSPRNVSDISIKEKEDHVKLEFSVENEKKDLFMNSSPCMSPQNGAENQEFVSIDMGDKGEADEDMEETQDEDALNYESKKIDISLWEFFSSYVRRSKTTKEKFAVLNKGMASVKDRMDILNIMKKFRELDKLKALLFEEDQLMLFNAMPKAEIKSGETPAEPNPELMKSKSFSRRILKKSTFIETNGNDEQMKKAYEALQMKAKKSKIDHKLLELYNNMQNKKK